jgi:hypothetical protein
MAETVLNVYSTFLNSMLHQYGYTQDDIGFLGTAFFIAVMIGMRDSIRLHSICFSIQ